MVGHHPHRTSTLLKRVARLETIHILLEEGSGIPGRFTKSAIARPQLTIGFARLAFWRWDQLAKLLVARAVTLACSPALFAMLANPSVAARVALAACSVARAA